MSNTKSQRSASWWPWIRPLLSMGMSLLCVVILVRGFQPLGYQPGGLVVLLIYLSGFALFMRVLGGLGKKSSGTESPKSDWPLSGPAGQLGSAPAGALFTISAMLTFLNPWQAVQHFRHMIGQLRAMGRLQPFHAEPELYQNRTHYQLPFEGEWTVINGGSTPETSHSWTVLNQRYAIDFVQADEHLRRHRDSGRKLTEYHCYGALIKAAAGGEVVSVRDGIGPSPAVGYYLADLFCRDFRGNHVIIHHAEGEYGVYAHLQKGSLRVKAGDRVVPGQPLGLCGHSGHSTEPHLHFHLQDRADFYAALGVPIRFDQCAVNGTVQNQVMLTESMRVDTRQ